MARLRPGEKQRNTWRIYQTVRSHFTGLREAEIAQMVGMERRRLNNYLRELQEQNKLYREGRVWHAK